MLEIDISFRLNTSKEGDWRDSALCAGSDSKQFYPEQVDEGMSDEEAAGISEEAEQVEKRAKEICKECKVAAACLEFAMGVERSSSERPGIFGGFNGKERHNLYRRRSDQKRKKKKEQVLVG